jgi:peptidoglycan biosynthesis protein MviN/MurJ (putative lipid II flippase)
VYYCLLLFFNYAVAIMVRVLFAFQAPLSILKVTVASLAANILLNFFLVRVMTPPAAGIALATAASSLIAAVLYFIVLKKRISSLHGFAICRSLCKITVFALVSGLAVLFTHKAIGGLSRPTLFNQGLSLAASALAGLAVFLLISALFRLEEFRKLHQLAATKLREKKGAAA